MTIMLRLYSKVFFFIFEMNCRGFPVWLKYVLGIAFRTDNEPFKVRNLEYYYYILQLACNMFDSPFQ
jgi:hypothetical protein